MPPEQLDTVGWGEASRIGSLGLSATRDPTSDDRQKMNKFGQCPTRCHLWTIHAYLLMFILYATGSWWLVIWVSLSGCWEARETCHLNLNVIKGDMSPGIDGGRSGGARSDLARYPSFETSLLKRVTDNQKKYRSLFFIISFWHRSVRLACLSHNFLVYLTF